MLNNLKNPAQKAFQVSSKDIEILHKREAEIEQRLDRSWRPERDEPVLGSGNIHYEVSEKTRAVNCGGMGLMQQLVGKLGLAESIDRRVEVLKRHLPYQESDHVLNLTYNVLSGGRCLQDVESRRRNVSYLDALGAQKIPAPSTEGDFLRRFSEGDVLEVMEAANEARLKVWARQPESFLQEAVIDVDGTTAETRGECKDGIDINYKGEWGYGPLLVTLANSDEVLYTRNRSANRPSHDGAVEWIDRAIELVRRGGFEQVRLRGDTDFSLTAHFDRWSEAGVGFTFGMDGHPSFVRRAEQTPEDQWQPLVRQPRYEVKTQRRRRPRNIKKQVVRKRGFKNLTLEEEQVTEIDYRPSKCRKTYRLVMLRKTIRVEKGQERLFDKVDYRFYVANLSRRKMSAAEVVFDNNGRCQQENVIEQLKNGVEAMRMPSDGLVSNWAYLAIASLAWNLKAWLGMILPQWQAARQLMRMEFRGFVERVIQVPCQIVRSGRRLGFRLLNVNEWTLFVLQGSLWLKQQRL